jgi:cell division protein FtsA
MAKIVTGIDVGTYHVKVVIAAPSDDPRQPPRILGTGYAESRGLKHGYVINSSEAARSIAAAVTQASRAAKVTVKRAYVGLGGMGLDEAFARGEIVVERGDSEITDRDIPRAIEASRKGLSPAAVLNREVLHTIPLKFSVDGTSVMGETPIGMKGMRVSVETLFITYQKKHMEDLNDAVERAGIEVEDFVASPLAASFVALSKRERRIGCALIILGSETMSLLVCEDGKPKSLKMFALGGDSITHDLALALRIPPEEAEALKHGAVLNSPTSKKKVNDLAARGLAEMFKQVEQHLKRIGKSELLPAGVLLAGGGALLQNSVDVAKVVLKLPARVASFSDGPATSMQLESGIWAVAYGLTVWGLTAGDGLERIESSSLDDFKDSFRSTFRWLKKFLP